MADFSSSQAIRPVREMELSRHADLTFAEAWLDSSEDFVAALAASVSRKAVDANRALGFLSNGSNRDYRPAESSERQYLRVLNALAVATSDGNEPIDSLLNREMRRFDRYRSPVVITASTDVGMGRNAGTRHAPRSAPDCYLYRSADRSIRRATVRRSANDSPSHHFMFMSSIIAPASRQVSMTSLAQL